MPHLVPLGCVPLKVGRGVTGLGWRLWYLFFPVSVCVLRLILEHTKGQG